MGYRVTKDLKTDVKVSGSLFLKDLFLLIAIPAAMWILTGGMVAEGLKIPYIIFNVLIVLALLQRPASNPGKQVYQVLLLLLVEDEQTYHMLQSNPDTAGETEGIRENVT